MLHFLQELNMGEFFDNFTNNGITTKEKLFYLNNDNLKLIKIPYAYRVRFLKRLKEIKNLDNIKKSINLKNKLSQIKTKKDIKQSKYEEIIIPKEEDDIELTHEEMRRTFTEAIYDFQRTHSKFNLDYNLNQESNTNNTSNTNGNDVNTVNDKMEDVIIDKGEYIEEKNCDKNNKVKSLLPLHCKKILCYQCWKVILRKDCFAKYEKPFCSERCCCIYESNNYTKCKNCGKKKKIVDCLPSFYDDKVHYCSLDCLEKIEPEKKNWMKKNLIEDDNESISSSLSNISEKPIDILDI